MSEFKITGQVELEKYFKKGLSLNNKLDKDLQSLVKISYTRIFFHTPADTRRTIQRWKIKKNGVLRYELLNDYASQDGKYSIAEILNDGRKEVKPIKAKLLFIPLSKRAKFKKIGAKIPESWESGTDYVLAKKSKAVRGTKFVEKEVEKSQSEIELLALRVVA